MKNTNKNMMYTFWSGAILLCLALVAVVLVFTNAVGNTGSAKAEALLALPNPPTAIFAMNDLMAVGCIHTLQKKGVRVPADISVVGFDNRECSLYVNPPLTTVSLPTKEIGMKTAEMVCAMIQGGARQSEGILLPCQIIERESVTKTGSERARDDGLHPRRTRVPQ